LLPRICSAQVENLIASGAVRGLSEQFETRQFSGRIRASRFPCHRRKATRQIANHRKDHRGKS